MIQKPTAPWYFHPLLWIFLAVLLDGLIEAAYIIIWLHHNPGVTITEDDLHLSSTCGKTCGAIFLFAYNRMMKKFA